MRSFAVALLVALLAGPVGVRAAAPPADFSDRIDTLVRSELARQRVPGIEVGVAYNGTVVLERGYGYRDLATKTPVDAETRFALGSITKTFTASLTMQLVAAHRLGLDDHLDRYLPDAPHARELTIRELLAQTTGLADYLSGSDLRGIVTRTDVASSDLLARIASEPLGFLPGTHLAYSNTNYLLLGMVIERVTRRPYNVELRALLDAKKLDAISYGRPEGPDVAVGYAANGPAPQWTPAVLSSAGAIWGNVDDMLMFDQAFFGGRFVPPEMVATMTDRVQPGDPYGYGFGWMVSDLDGHREVWHNGGVPGFNARNSVFPTDRLAVVVLGNTIAFDEGPIVHGVLELIDPTIVGRPSPPPARPLEDPATTTLARDVVARLQHNGTIDRARYTDAANATFTDALVKSVGVQFAPLGAPAAFTLRSRSYISNMQVFVFRLQFAAFGIDETLALDGNGKIALLLFRPALPAPALPEP